jgi:lantibiotic modifying enzyme
VKEDILCRFGELGVFVKAGNLYFNPCLLRRNEFLEKAKTFNYMNVHSEHKTLNLEKDSLSFTYCQVPIIYKIAEDNGLEVTYKDGHSTKFETLSLDVNTSKQVFERTGDVLLITVRVRASELR